MIDTFRDPFMQTALAASLVVGAVCAYLGVYVVLRRIVFVGAALAQISSAGVGLALLTGFSPSALSLLLTLGGVAAFSVKPRDRRVTQESYIGVGYAVASALAVLFVAKNAQGEAHLLDVLSGNILTVTAGQIWLMAGASAVALALQIAFHKQFLFSAFDPDTARASGLKVAFWDLLFFLILGVVIALGIRLAGTLLVFAFLVVPAAAALLLSQRLGRVYLIAIVAAWASSVLGLYLSFKYDLPSGPAIIAVSCVVLMVSWVVGRVGAGR